MRPAVPLLASAKDNMIDLKALFWRSIMFLQVTTLQRVCCTLPCILSM